MPTSTIHKILRNRIYTGDFDFDGITYHGTHEPIVSRELWEQAQAILDGRGSKRTHRVKDMFASGVMSPDLKAAETAVCLTRERDSAATHTLSTVQADIGKLKESRDTLLRYLSNDERIGDEAWYVLGRMAEQLELEEVASKMYSQITKPERQTGDSVYELAQIRLAGSRFVASRSTH